MRILVTGAAGFIGFHVARRLLKEGHAVVGLDNLNAYYDPAIKLERRMMLEQSDNFTFIKGDLKDRPVVETAMLGVDDIIHLAAQAGVGYSAKNPQAYVDSNITGFLNILETMRKQGHRRLLYASSSSVYGSATPPWREDVMPTPTSFYGATKLMNEQMALTYSINHGIHSIGMRFFTVFGPWGRPDMMIYRTLEALFKDGEVSLFDHGRTARDYTYIDDCVEAISRLRTLPATGATVVNIGSDRPYDIAYIVTALEAITERRVRKLSVAKPSWDIQKTWADLRRLKDMTGYKPGTPIMDGLYETAVWAKTRRWKPDTVTGAQHS